MRAWKSPIGVFGTLLAPSKMAGRHLWLSCIIMHLYHESKRVAQGFWWKMFSPFRLRLFRERIINWRHRPFFPKNEPNQDLKNTMKVERLIGKTASRKCLDWFTFTWISCWNYLISWQECAWQNAQVVASTRNMSNQDLTKHSRISNSESNPSYH